MEKFFNKRDRKISNLNLMADSLGYSLRENVSLFSVDDHNSFVTFVTEGGNIIEGNYYFGEEMILDNIQVESGEMFKEEEKFDSYTKNQISSFVENIYNDELVGAGEIFDTLIESWNARVKFNQTVEKLEEQTESFNNTFNIVETKEFERFMEVSENISKFLQENAEKINGIPEIVNAVKLSNVISEAFGIPRMNLEQLQEQGSFSIALGENRDIYEMVCKQELVKKEILESKKSFDTVWVTEPSISNLATKMFEEDEEIEKALVEAFVNVPYLALISKKQLSSTISNNLNTLHEQVGYTKSDLKEFVGKLFEMKKPLKDLVSNLLQEKYGVNVNNLKETPTFKTLLNTQVLVMEALAKISPRNSVIKECFADMCEMLKSKNGVQAIDVNQGLKYLFENSGFAELYSQQPIISSFSLNESLTSDEEDVEMILSELISEKKEKKKLDPVGKEDDDVDNDGDSDSSDEYLKKRRKAVGKAMGKDKEEKDKEEAMEEEEVSTMSTQELMKTLSDIEELVSGPEDLGDE